MEQNIRTIEIEVKPEAGDDVREGLLSSGEPLPVEVNIDSVRRETDSEGKMDASSRVAVKREVGSDEEELQPPAVVTVEGFKGDIHEDLCNILPGNSTINSQTSLYGGKSGLQLHWKNQQGQILLHNDLSGNVEHLVDGKNLLVAPVQGSCSTLTSDNQNLQNNLGTLVGDSNVQYVYLTPLDSLYYVENPENIAMCQNEGNVKQVTSANNNLQIINISTDKCERSVNTVFPSGGKIKNTVIGDNVYLPNMQSSDRKSIGESGSSVGLEKCEIINELMRQQGEVGNSVIHAVSGDFLGKGPERNLLSASKLAPTPAGEKDLDTCLFLRKGCEPTCVMNCSTSISVERRREINRIFCAMSAKERKKFILQHCSKKVVLEKAVVGTVRTIKHFRIDFNLQASDGKRVQVCRLFFFTTLGFGQTMFDNYLSSIFPSPETESFLPLSCKCIKGNRSLAKKYDKNSECQLHSKITSHAHKDIFHNHIEGYLKTISIPQGDRLRTVRYLPKDISFHEMYEDFTQKHPEIPSSFEMYRNFIVFFTS